MRKQEADAIKEEFIGDLDHKDALELMSEEELEDSLSILNLIEHWLGASINDYSLDVSHDLLDTEEERLVRTIWFSKGLEDSFVSITPSGTIAALDADIPMLLLAQVAQSLHDLMEETWTGKISEK
tara:strand:- start:29 stop:406 length:378 start_codon:yes stop_codon:yes gene_type:complete